MILFFKAIVPRIKLLTCGNQECMCGSALCIFLTFEDITEDIKVKSTFLNVNTIRVYLKNQNIPSCLTLNVVPYNDNSN
jgi:hypothetical protein